jgi:hypothetical protein
LDHDAVDPDRGPAQRRGPAGLLGAFHVLERAGN